MYKLLLTNHQSKRVELNLDNEGDFYRFVNTIDKKIKGVFRANLYIGGILVCIRYVNVKPARVYHHKSRKWMPFEHFIKHWPDYSYTTRLLYAQYIDDPEIYFSKHYR